MDIEYKDYRLKSVYKNINSQLKDEIVDFWVKNGAVSSADAERRVAEVVYSIRNSSGSLTGLSTACLQKFMDQEQPFYFMRMFIRQEDRGVHGLYRLVSRRTREFLKYFDLQFSVGGRGTIIVLENPKFLRKGNFKMLARNGWKYYGQGPRGNHIWYDCFNGEGI
ncbi:MAG: hypothetical protein PHN84_05540 [Desulfuromonadaceae bacterium]|nr:hypothetical protein [Desulfuromonadaceae bacterium]MDD2854978.1 hypothetical protein [Desulfuromonadaceae bacterium]